MPITTYYPGAIEYFHYPEGAIAAIWAACGVQEA
jgi:hypothetical protein